MDRPNVVVQNNFIFIDQNDTAAETSRRARLRRSQRRDTFTLDISLLESSQTPPIELPAPILHTLDHRVIERFFARWSEGQTTLGCLASMPALLQAAGPNSAMQTAILAVAYADLAVFERNRDRGTRAYQAYCGTLQRLQIELADQDFMASDGYLATVLTVDAFELLYMNRAEPLGIHTQAIARLLELRKDSAVTQGTVHSLWRSAYQRIHVRPLFCDLPPIAFGDPSGYTGRDDCSTGFRTLEIVANTCQAMHDLKQDQGGSVKDTNPEQTIHPQNTLRGLLAEAQCHSEFITSLSQSIRIPFDVPPFSDLRQVFPMTSAITYNNTRMARDQLILSVCIVKILDILIELRTQNFSDQIDRSATDLDIARDFLLGIHPDLNVMQEKCRLILDMTPFLIGLSSSSNAIQANGCNLLDTGVITVKSPLKTIENLLYVSPDIKQEARGVRDFIDAYRHVVWRP